MQRRAWICSVFYQGMCLLRLRKQVICCCFLLASLPVSTGLALKHPESALLVIDVHFSSGSPACDCSGRWSRFRRCLLHERIKADTPARFLCAQAVLARVFCCPIIFPDAGTAWLRGVLQDVATRGSKKNKPIG